jgi:hypothetical protein
MYQCSTTTLNDFLATIWEISSSSSTSSNTSMTYTELRKRAIRQELVLHRRFNSTASRSTSECNAAPLLDSMVHDCFEIWLQERHLAAQRYLFSDALEMLQTIKSTFPNVCIAAITNGRGNPLEMNETLTPWFDFCISGEDANVFPHRKLHHHIYQVAVWEYQHRYPSSSLLQQRQNMNNGPYAQQNQQQQQQQQQQLHQQQHIWCHVGDCLGNDVGASASCGAQAVWLDLESDDQYKKNMGLLKRRNQEHETATHCCCIDNSIIIIINIKSITHSTPTAATALVDGLAKRSGKTCTTCERSQGNDFILTHYELV